MSISNIERFKFRVLQQLEKRGTYGPRTYKAISDSTGIKYGTVKYLTKKLIEEGKINTTEIKPESSEKSKENSTKISHEVKAESQNGKLSALNGIGIEHDNVGDAMAIKARKEYIKKMVKGRAGKNATITASYINYCRQNLNTKNLTLEDFEILGELIGSNVDLMTAENIKLGILGFIRVNKIHLAKKFYNQCSLEVLKHLKIAMCTKEELNEIGKELNDYEQKLQIYAKLKQGYPIETILEETNVSETIVRRMANSLEKEKQARQNKESEGMEH